MRLRSAAAHRQQRGIALGVVLVLLAAGSVISALSMRGSIVDEMIVRNYALKEATFRAAELAARSASDEARLADALAAGVGKEVTAPLQWQDNRVKTSATLAVEGTGLPRGYSIGSGGFTVYRFRARGQASIDAVAATSAVEQGIERLSPAP